MKRIVEFFYDNCEFLSMTRLTQFICISGYLTWATYITYTTKVIPDIPMQLAFLIGSLYAINKVGSNVNIGNKKEE